MYDRSARGPFPETGSSGQSLQASVSGYIGYVLNPSAHRRRDAASAAKTSRLLFFDWSLYFTRIGVPVAVVQANFSVLPPIDLPGLANVQGNGRPSSAASTPEPSAS